MNRLFYLIVLLFIAGCTGTDPELEKPKIEDNILDRNYVSLSEALKNAEIEFSKIYGTTRSDVKTYESVDVFSPEGTRSGEQETYGYYIVNYTNNSGFAILSADRRRASVFAISDEGRVFLSDTISNKGLSWYFNNYLGLYGINEESFSNSSPNPSPDPNPSDPYDIKEFITDLSKPLLKGFMASFHQSYPYNKYCFTSSGQQSVVGCVPLAVGTVMGYYEYPKSIEGYNFDWKSMKNNSNHDGWSHLFEILGRTGYLNADYGIFSTGASPSDIAPTFTRLGYSNATFANFSATTVNKSLKNSQPVLCGGQSNEGGHRWVIDGSVENRLVRYLNGSEVDTSLIYYYHCIWGWEGNGNGYYRFDNNLGGTSYNPYEETESIPYIFSNLSIVYGYETGK